MKRITLYLLILLGIHGSLRAQCDLTWPSSGSVFINEMGNFEVSAQGTLRNAEYVELVVLPNASNPFAPVDLTDWIIDDNNTPEVMVGNEQGHIRFSDCFPAVPPGSIILIYNGYAPAVGINPADDGLPNDAGIYQISLQDPCICKVEGSPDHDDSSYDRACRTPRGDNWNEFIPLRNFGDALQIREPDGALVHAFWWTHPDEDFSYEGIGHVNVVELPTVPLAGRSIQFGSGDWTDNANFVIHTQGSPGFSNSAENEAFVQSLIGSTSSISTIEIECRSLAPAENGTAIGAIEVHIRGLDSEDASWTLEYEGPVSGTLTIEEDQHTELGGLPNGTYAITVTSVEGCSGTCSATIPFGTTQSIDICPGDCMDIEAAFTPIFDPSNAAANCDHIFTRNGDGRLSDAPVDDPNVCIDTSTTFVYLEYDADGQVIAEHILEVDVRYDDFGILPPAALLCPGDLISLDATHNDFDRYDWSTGADAASISVDQAGTYSVTATALDGCTVTDEAVVSDALGDPDAIINALEANGYRCIAVDRIDFPAVQSGTTSSKSVGDIQDLTGGATVRYNDQDMEVLDVVRTITDIMADDEALSTSIVASDFCAGQISFEDFISASTDGPNISIFLVDRGPAASEHCLMAKIHSTGEVDAADLLDMYDIRRQLDDQTFHDLIADHQALNLGMTHDLQSLNVLTKLIQELLFNGTFTSFFEAWQAVRSIWKFFRLCTAAYLANDDPSILIPQACWDTELTLTPYVAGVINRIWGDGFAIVDIIKVWSPNSVLTGTFFSSDARIKREQTVLLLVELFTLMTDPVEQAVFIADIVLEIEDYLTEHGLTLPPPEDDYLSCLLYRLDDFPGNKNQCRYWQAQLTYDIVTLFVGYGVITSFAKAGRISKISSKLREGLTSGKMAFQRAKSQLSAIARREFHKDFVHKPEMVKRFDNGSLKPEAYEALHLGPYRKDIGALELFGDPSVLLSRQRILDEGINLMYPNVLVEELTLINHYTTSAHSTLNAALRSGVPNNYYQAFENILNNALSKLPTFNGDRVYRGVSGVEADIARTWGIGDNIHFKDFKSTTTNPIVVQDFTGSTLYEISNPRGKEICNISCLPLESEVLFSSGSNFRVTDIVDDFEIVNLMGDPVVVTKISLEFIE